MSTKYLTLTAIALLLTASPAFAESASAEKAPPAAAAEEKAADAVAEDVPAAPTETEAKGDEAKPADAEAATAAEAPATEEKKTEIGHEGSAGGEGGHAMGAHAKPVLPDIGWSFNGPFGTYDKAALQRGFLVYKQVCSACHGLKKIYYRNLEALGYSDAQVKTIAAEYTAIDGPNDEGDMFERPARPSDKFKLPYENDKAAAFANGGAIPPDLSLITKARHGGANYVYGILTGYEEAPAGVTLLQGQHYNKIKDGNIIAMAPPLSDGLVSYEDQSPQTVDQYARDVAQFLTWAAEPEMEARKRMGAKVIIFLAIFGLIMLAAKRKIWEKLH